MKNVTKIERGLLLRRLYLLIIRPLGIVRRLILRYASLGQVLVPPTKTWIYQRNHFLSSMDISLAIDVGGNLGQWALEARETTNAKIVTFEPDPRCSSRLVSLSALDRNWEIVESAAGNVDSTETLQLFSVEHGYSSLKNVTKAGEIFSGEIKEGMETAHVKVVRLDSYFHALQSVSENVWLKIDVQGFELEVLQGAEGILPKITAIEIEIPMIQLYEESERISTIMKFMEDKGFVLCSIFSERWSKYGNGDCDALFVKKIL